MAQEHQILVSPVSYNVQVEPVGDGFQAVVLRFGALQWRSPTVASHQAASALALFHIAALLERDTAQHR